jgi:hypothetical protein
MKNPLTSKLAAIAVLFAGFSLTAHAQIGSGWSSYSPSSKIHISVNGELQIFNYSNSVSTPGGTYTNSGGIETFHMKNSSCNRVERRMENNYTSGQRQFQGEVRVSSPSNGQSVMQVFGGVTNATALQIRAHNTSGGQLRRYDSELIASGVFGVWVRLNVIHDANANTVTIYANGANKGTFPDRGNATHYHKYGTYGTLNTSNAKSEYRNVRHFQK